MGEVGRTTWGGSGVRHQIHFSNFASIFGSIFGGRSLVHGTQLQHWITCRRYVTRVYPRVKLRATTTRRRSQLNLPTHRCSLTKWRARELCFTPSEVSVCAGEVPSPRGVQVVFSSTTSPCHSCKFGWVGSVPRGPKRAPLKPVSTSGSDV